MGKWSSLRNSTYRGTVKSFLLYKKFWGLVEMTFGLVNVSFSLPVWQAVKMTFLYPVRSFNFWSMLHILTVCVVPDSTSKIYK